MRIPLFLLTVYVLFALEASFLHHLQIPFLAPDLGAVVALYLAMTQPALWTPVVVLVIGILQDGFAMGAPIGLHGAVNLLVYLLGVGLSGRITFRAGLPVMILAFGAAVVAQFCRFALTAIFDQRITEYEVIMTDWFVNGLITAPFGPVIYSLFDRLSRWSEGRRGRDRYGRLGG